MCTDKYSDVDERKKPHERFQGGEMRMAGEPRRVLLWNPRKKIVLRKSGHTSPVQTEVRKEFIVLSFLFINMNLYKNI